MNTKIMEGIFAIACIAILISCTDVVLSGNDGKKLLSDEVIKLMNSLGNEKPVYLDALWPSRSLIRDKKILSTRMPQKVIEKSVYWIKAAIKKEWLPEELQNYLILLKDFKKWEKRDKQGIVFSQRVGDYIIAEYEIHGHNIKIQENGTSLSLLVIFPKATDISQNPKNFIKKCIETFLNFPPQKIDQLTYHLQKEGNLYYGNVLCDWEDKMADLLNNRGLIATNMWWQRFTICTDGTFFFISMAEVEGKLVSPQAQPGLPDRF